jgi:uncharacterized membrane protein
MMKVGFLVFTPLISTKIDNCRTKGTSLHDLLYSSKRMTSVDYVRVVTSKKSIFVIFVKLFFCFVAQFWKYLKRDQQGRLLMKNIIYSVLKALQVYILYLIFCYLVIVCLKMKNLNFW